MEADENDIQPLQKSSSSGRTASTGDKTPSINAKNSTIIAGGMSLPEMPLSMSPISEASDGKEAPPGGYQATPAPSRRRSVTQSPMFMTVMQKSMLKAKKEERASVVRMNMEEKISTIAEESRGKGRPSTAKGMSATNPSKGKSFASPLSRFEGDESSSESDWDVEPAPPSNIPQLPPLPLHLAFEVNKHSFCFPKKENQSLNDVQFFILIFRICQIAVGILCRLKCDSRTTSSSRPKSRSRGLKLKRRKLLWSRKKLRKWSLGSLA